MERLSFSDTTPYSGLEAAVHLARYSITRTLCRGRRVLDVACGEGYGSYFMSGWGAKHVDGVDLSTDAIATSRRLFGSDTVYFIEGRAEQVDEIFPTRNFDLIVALETIEHVEDPVRFLTALHRLLSREGIIVISCPNDWWYYPAANQSNPHHRQKYRFNEFQEASEAVLGPAAAWYLGAPVSGFANVSLDGYESANAESTQLVMRRARDVPLAVLVPAEYKMGPIPETASYFVGVWGEASDLTSATILPLGMNSFRDGAFSAWGPGQVAKLHSENDRLSQTLADRDRELAARNATLSDLSRQHEHLKIESERLSLTVAAQDAEKQQLLLEIARGEVETHRAAQQASRLSVDLCDREAQLAAINPTHEKAEEERAVLKGQLEELDRDHRKAVIQVLALSEERLALREEVRTLRSEFSLMQERIVNQEQEIAGLSRELSNREDRLGSLTGSLERAETERANLVRQLEDFERDHQKALIQVHALAKERVILLTNVAASSGLAQCACDPSAAGVGSAAEAAITDLATLRSRLATVEAEAQAYRSIKARIPACLVPVLRWFIQLGTR